MARITVEDCVHVVENRFALCRLAVKRARQLMSGARTLVESSRDKSAVLSLREIATGKVRFDRPVKDVLSGKYDPPEVEVRLVPAGGQVTQTPPSGGLF
jgi:DNA-directed RNA polymerase subunit omega